MSINTTLAGLSTNQALNGPDGTVDLPSTMDDAIRYALSFIASLRDGVGFTTGALVASLGFTPVQQGTGPSQTSDLVKIGWSTGGFLRLAINGSDFGSLWPINMSGNAASATLATNASNSSAVNGISGWSYSNLGINPTYLWASNGSTAAQFLVQPANLSVNFATSAGAATSAGVCTGNSSTASLASNSNAVGGVTLGGLVQNAASVASLSNVGFSQMNANIGGTTCFWGMSISDGRLKINVRETEVDSLARISALDFVGYEFKRLGGDVQIDDGRRHAVGFIAQQAETIDPNWIATVAGGIEGEHKAPNDFALLVDALHAIKQLGAKVAALEARA